jgi:hypothetical protein
VKVGKHDLLAGADPTGDRLADLARSDDDDNLAHEDPFFSIAEGSFLSRPSVAWPWFRGRALKERQ